MNSLETQARSFFLRCRARSWQSRPDCASRAYGKGPREAFSTVPDNRPAEHSYDPNRVETHTQKSTPYKPYYVTTPIYYVNAGALLHVKRIIH